MSAGRTVEAGGLLARLAQPERLRLERARLERAAADLAIPASERLSEQRRAQTLHILRDLFADLESGLRQSLASALIGLGPAGREAAVELGETHGVVWRHIERVILSPPLSLLDAALTRAGEHALSAPLRANADGMLAKLLNRSPDSQLSQRLASLELAESKRRDQFGEPQLPFAELDEFDAIRAAWLAGAALRAEILARHPVDESMLDAAVEDAVRRLIAARGADCAARQAEAVVRRLEALHLLDTDLLLALLGDGQISLLIAALAFRASLTSQLVERLLVASDDAGWLLLLRALDLPVALMGPLAALHGAPVGLARMESLPLADARRQLARWRRDPILVDAIDSLGAGH